MSEDVFEIPLENLKKGISLCFRKSYAFTSNAKFLFENYKDPDIVSALLVSAIEELGKGLILKELHIAQNTSIPKWVFGQGFQTHTKKSKWVLKNEEKNHCYIQNCLRFYQMRIQSSMKMEVCNCPWS